ncbi:MAG: nuclear transport factor 2 family protein [Pyrinomonadaceae bacterium]
MPKELKMPQPIAAFIEATNNHKTDEFLATLSDSAVITDEAQDYSGIAAIKEWSDEKYIGAKVTLEVVDIIDRDGKTIVTFEVDGNFDKTGLPDPFIMDFHFTVDGNKIAALNIRLAGE